MLNIEFAGIKLSNPAVLASGFLGTSVDIMQRVADNGAGAVTTKSIGPIKREGNPGPAVVEIDNGIYNAVGLPTPGYKNMDDEFSRWKELTVPLIASVYGSTVDDYVNISKYIAKFKPAIIELNVSCPNKDDGLAFGVNPEMMKQLITKIKSEVSIPIMPKMTPNCDDVAEIAYVCQEAGADAICAINTVAKVIEHPVLKAPILGYGKGGISGPIVKDIALKKVIAISEAVDIPILGLGGIQTGKDAIEMIKAGASAIGIGSGIYFHGIDVFKKVTDEMEKIMKKNGWKSIEDIK